MKSSPQMPQLEKAVTHQLRPSAAKKFFKKLYTYSNVHHSIINNSQDVETTYVPINSWMDKEGVVHMYNGILPGHKKHETLPFATIWMDFESAMLSEISQKEKDKYCTISLICGILKTNKISEQIKPNKNKSVDTENRAVVSREEGTVGGEWNG